MQVAGFFVLVAYVIWLAFVENLRSYPAYFAGTLAISAVWITLVRLSLKQVGRLDLTWLQASGAACYTAVSAALMWLAISTAWAGVQKSGWQSLTDPFQGHLLWTAVAVVFLAIAAEGFRKQHGVPYTRAFYLAVIATTVGLPCALIVFRLARRIIEGR